MSFKESLPSWKVALVLFIIAILSRVYGLSSWHLVGDEYFTATLAYDRSQSLINPLYYVLVVICYGLFGDAVWISRIPAFVISALSVPVIYWFGARLLNPMVGLFAAIITIFSAWHLWFAQFARFYSAVFLFGILSYYFFYLALVNGRVRDLLFAAGFSLLGMMTHATFTLVPVACCSAYVIAWLFRKRLMSIAPFSTKIPGIFLVLGTIITIAFMSLVGFDILKVWLGNGNVWGYGSLLLLPQVAKYVQIPITAAAAIGFLFLCRNHILLAGFLGIGILVPMVIMMAAASVMAVRPDYVFYTLPLIIMLAGYACNQVHEKFAQSHYSSILIAAVIVSLLLPSFASHFLAKRSLDLRDSIAYIEKNYQPGDQILSFVSGFNLYASTHYDLLPFIGGERDNSIKWRLELDKITQSDEDRTWMLISSKRKDLAFNLKQWLFCNAALVHRDHATRLDAEVDGFQIFLVSNKTKNAIDIATCKKVTR